MPPPEQSPMRCHTAADGLRHAQDNQVEMPKQFGLLAALSLAFSLTNSWIGESGVFATGLVVGGGPGVFWGLLLAGFSSGIITLGLAELASAFPSSGGQYHYTFMVNPKSSRVAVSYAVGWLSVFAWWMLASSATLLVGQSAVMLATIHHPEYTPTAWQIYLIYVLVTIIAVAIIVLLPTLLPKIEIFFFALTLFGFVSFTIAVLTKSKQKQSAATVFLEYTNQTGWNNGIAFLIGVGQQMFGFLGLDCASHVAEEMPNPTRGVPRVMALTMIIGIMTSAVWTVAFMFSAADYDAAIAHQSPITEICRQALGSDAAGLAVGSILLVLFFGGALACLVAAGRQTWAFARDNGMPYSHIIGQIHPTLKAPVNATILTGVFCIIYGLIYIGSSAAFTSFIGLSILGLNMTYVFPQALVLLYGRKNVLPKRPINLGSVLGPLVNLYSVVWVMLYVVIFCFPTYLDTSANSMNYLSVVVVGVLIFILISWWVGKRKTYGGPIIDDGVLEGMSHVSPDEVICQGEKPVEAAGGR